MFLVGLLDYEFWYIYNIEITMIQTIICEFEKHVFIQLVSPKQHFVAENFEKNTQNGQIENVQI